MDMNDSIFTSLRFSGIHQRYVSPPVRKFDKDLHVK